MNAIARDLPTGLVEKAYGRWARIYDRLCARLFLPAHLGAAEAANRVGGDVLEVGVGTGLLLPLYRPDLRVTGVDLSAAMLERARIRVAADGLRNVVALEVGDVHVLAHPDASYDAIVLPFVLTLVSAPETALDNCLRMLRPGGEIIIVSHFRSQSRWLSRLEQALAPVVAGIGLRPDFPIARIDAWRRARGCVLHPPQSLGRLDAYTLLRISR